MSQVVFQVIFFPFSFDISRRLSWDADLGATAAIAQAIAWLLSIRRRNSLGPVISKNISVILSLRFTFDSSCGLPRTHRCVYHRATLVVTTT